MAHRRPTHVAYGDEASHNTGRYRAVAALTLSFEDAGRVTRELTNILDRASLNEFKWAKLRTARTRFAALELIHGVMDMLGGGAIRLDALTWDTQDSRHAVRRRSDTRNLRRMYYFLLRNSLGRRWPEGCVWELRLDNSDAEPAGHLRYLGNEEEMNEDARRVQVHAIRQVDSHAEPLVQVADLFAGLAVWSRASYESYERWCSARPMGQDDPGRMHWLSNSDAERCRVLHEFYRRCKAEKLGVGLVGSRGLRTRDPR